MTARIRNLRMSLVWCETLPSMILDAPASSGAIQRRVGHEHTYRELFDGLHRGDDAGELSLPWLTYEYNYFWYYYTEQKHPKALSGSDGWKHLTPFRQRLLKSADTGWNLLAEGYYYPFGTGLVLSIDARMDRELADAVDWSIGVRREPLTIRRDDGTTSSQSLDNLAGELLGRLRQNVGASGPVTVHSPTAFSVTTAIRAEGVDSRQPVSPNVAIHQALHGWTNWSPGWKDEDPLDLTAGVIIETDRGRWARGDALYASNRSRAVWFPRLSVRAPADTDDRSREKIRALQCYHRNMVSAGLQVESLVQLARDGAKRLRSGTSLRPSHSYLLRRAVGALGRLRGGVSTYRSRSAQTHIEQSGIVADLDYLRSQM